MTVDVLTDRPAPVHSPRRSGPRRSRDNLAGWGFASPALFLIAAFGLVPVVWSLVLSFQSNDLSGTSGWVGLANYRQLAKDPLFTDSIRRTLVYTALFVPITVVGALLLAAALNRKIRFIGFYRTAVFIPVVTSTVATAFVFNLLLDPDYGLVNSGLSKVSLPTQGFFADPSEALYAILAMTVWGWIGFGVIIYLAALQAVPQELLEAAQLDGCSAWTSFWRVQVPQLAPATTFLVVWLSINALQLFDEIYVTTKGGPVHATTVVVYYLYQQAFQFFHGGYAAAIAYVLFLAILAITLVELRVSRRWVDQ
ncbi:sugar ABC transporter permease [Acidothermaceae bacterium B102]|nr:sugar ABC transporter permease [Acidothermaceae bacterium B102]